MVADHSVRRQSGPPLERWYFVATMGPRSALVAILVGTVLAATPSSAQSADPDLAVDVPPGDEYADTDPSPPADFGPALDPYGTWGDDPTYGAVWTPNEDQVAAGFQPYDTAGSWNYVDGDYVWVSDYAWGWVCFHYGRWAFSAGRWVWIPGRAYAGAWVSWRVGDDDFGYVGWAPMAPAWIWIGGSPIPLGFASPEPWAFTTYRELLSPQVGSHVVTGGVAATAAARTQPFVPAQPSVGTGPVARSAPHGPPPAMLRIDVSRLALPALSAQELRARTLARPSTAIPLGARPPSPHVIRTRPRRVAAPRDPAPTGHETAHGRR